MIPPKLKQGDTIAVFSPSSPATATVAERYLRGKKYIESKGFNFIEGKLTGKSDYYRSGSILERADELNLLIHNSNVKCIISAIGGMNSNSILPYIDYEHLKNNPKIIVGYSDVSALLLGIFAKTGLTTYYGPAVVASFGEFPPFVDETYKYFSDILCNELVLPQVLPTPKYWSDEFVDWKTQNRSKHKIKNKLVPVNDGATTGRLIGGNLNTMQGI